MSIRIRTGGGRSAWLAAASAMTLAVVLCCMPATAFAKTRSGQQADGGSNAAFVSADGRYVAFVSEASNLVAGDTNGLADVFVHDRKTGKTARVDVGPGGIQSNGGADSPSISSDGRWVAFWSFASNLVPGDTNGVSDVFVHDMLTGHTSRVSGAPGGGQASSEAGLASISADGRYVIYEAVGSSSSGAMMTFYVNDRLKGTTKRLDVPGAVAGGTSYVTGWPTISARGRYVSFVSSSPYVVKSDTNDARDAFVLDRTTGRISRASLTAQGGQIDGDSDAPSISSSGRYVVFSSTAPGVVDGKSAGDQTLYVRDLRQHITQRLSVGPAGDALDGHFARSPSITSDGLIVAFVSDADDLVAGDTNGVPDVFVADRLTGAITRVSVGSSTGSGTRSASAKAGTTGARGAAGTPAATAVAAETTAASGTSLAPSRMYTAVNNRTVMTGRPVQVTAWLVSPNGRRIPRKTAVLEASTNGTEWTRVGGLYSRTGVYRFTIRPERRVYYRVRYAGDAWNSGSASAARLVAVRAYLSNPMTSARVYRNKALDVVGVLRARHLAGASSVTLQAYQNIGGTWKLVRVFKPRNKTENSYTVYRTTVSLPYAGVWRIRAVHADRDNVTSASPGYAQVTVLAAK